MRCLILALFLAIVQTTSPVPRKAADNPTDASRNANSQASPDKPATAAPQPRADIEVPKENENTGSHPRADDAQKSLRITELPPVSVTRDWMDKTSWTFGAILVVVGIVGVCAAYRTLRAIERQARIMRRQTAHIARQALSMRRQTTHLRNAARAAKSSTDALIASERAWIDGELVIDQEKLGLGIYHYTLKARNLGRTPGQIYSYRISPGILNAQFSPDALIEHQTWNLYIFLGSGEEKPLREGFGMDEFFPSDADWGTQCAFCVTIIYADVVTGTPKQRIERKTSFVYLYSPLLRSIERLGPYNEYS
jgi:hypothetical protein